MMLLIAHYYATRSAAQSIKQLVRCSQRLSTEHSVTKMLLQTSGAKHIQVWVLEHISLCASLLVTPTLAEMGSSQTVARGLCPQLYQPH